MTRHRLYAGVRRSCANAGRSWRLSFAFGSAGPAVSFAPAAHWRIRPFLNSKMTVSAAPTLTVAEAAELLGRHRTRLYALVRSDDLVTRAVLPEGTWPGQLGLVNQLLDLIGRGECRLAGVSAGRCPAHDRVHSGVRPPYASLAYALVEIMFDQSKFLVKS